MSRKGPRKPKQCLPAPSSRSDATSADDGLTLASLKHVKRQRDKLAEENLRLKGDLQQLREEHCCLQKEHAQCSDGGVKQRILETKHSELQEAYDELQVAHMAYTASMKMQEDSRLSDEELEALRLEVQQARQVMVPYPNHLILTLP